MSIDYIFFITNFSLFFFINLIFYITDKNEKRYYLNSCFNYILIEIFLFFFEIIFIFIFNNKHYSAIFFLNLHVFIFLLYFIFLFNSFLKSDNFFKNYYLDILIFLGFLFKNLIAINWQDYLNIFLNIQNNGLNFKNFLYVISFSLFVISLTLIIKFFIYHSPEINIIYFNF